MGDTPFAVLALPYLGKAFIGLQRVAAGGDEIDRVIEVCTAQSRVRRGGKDFGVKIIGEEGLADGATEDMLTQHIERAGAQRRCVLGVGGHRIDGGAALQDFEAIGRHQHRFRRLVIAVIGPADPLHQPRRTFRRADIDDQIDIAPVDAKIERGGAHHGAQLAGAHRVLDLAALRDIERTVMQRDGEVVVVDAPQRLEGELRLAAGIDENQRRLVLLDQIVDFAERVARRVPGPGQALAGVEHRHLRLRAGLRDDEVGLRRALQRLRHQKTAQLIGFGDCGGKTDRRNRRRQLKQPRHAERQQIAALRCHQRMQFVEHDAAQRAEHVGRIGGSQKECELFRRGQQDVRRIAALALPLRRRRIAGARLQPDG